MVSARGYSHYHVAIEEVVPYGGIAQQVKCRAGAGNARMPNGEINYQYSHKRRVRALQFVANEECLHGHVHH